MASTKPKETYVAPSGKTVKIDPKETSVNTIRNTVTPQEYATRSTRVEHHYHTHYGDRYDYYRNRPYIDIGGGYSSIFWYSMLDWNAQRRAEWLYHNQHRIDSQIYQQQLQNEELRREIERIKAQNTPVNPNYVDKEYSENPDLMYDDNYVAAAYNPAPVPVSTTRSWTWVWWLTGFCVVGGFVWLFFIKDWKTKE